MPLGRLLREVSSLSPRSPAALPADGLPVAGVAHDSRRVRGGEVFVCLRGQRADGHRFAEQAARAGAVLVIGEGPTPPPGLGPVPYLEVSDSRRALALLCCAFHGHPSRELVLSAVTGTNGKTSTTWMLHAIHEEAGWPSAVLGTLGRGTPDPGAFGPESAGAVAGRPPGTGLPRPRVPLREGPQTTPEAPELQAELVRWRDAGIRAGAMEASSHGLFLRRTYGTRFACVVFTNLTIDHLDFHGTLDAYRDAKALLFRAEERGPGEPPATAVVNSDDPATEAVLRGSTDRIQRFGRGEEADVRLLAVDASSDGVVLAIRHPGGECEVRSPLLGSFQAENLLAAFAAALALGIGPDAAARGLGRLRAIPGRMERVPHEGPFPVVVDYAHTPDALRRACEALRSTAAGRLLLVFGCGGERDRSKRPLMGAVAARAADRIYLTDDNPRREPPESIRAEIRAGIVSAGGSCTEIGDREEAIHAALLDARPGDAVLIAGKGHEQGQIRGEETLPFDDRKVAGRLLGEMRA